MESHKTCPDCRRLLTLDAFPNESRKVRKPGTYCRECRLLRDRDYRAKLREQGEQSYSTRYHRKLRLAALMHYGGGDPKCECCGENRYEFLSIDHVNGGGGKHREQMRSEIKTHLALWLKNNGYPSGFRVLCHNCNQAIGAFGYCPHALEREGRSAEIITIPKLKVRKKRAALLAYMQGQARTLKAISSVTGQTPGGVKAMLAKCRREGLVIQVGRGLWRAVDGEEPPDWKLKRELLIDALRESPKGRREIADRTGQTVSAVSLMLQRLRREGTVEQIRKGLWRVTGEDIHGDQSRGD